MCRSFIVVGPEIVQDDPENHNRLKQHRTNTQIKIQKLSPTFSEMGTLKKNLWNNVASGGKKASERLG